MQWMTEIYRWTVSSLPSNFSEDILTALLEASSPALSQPINAMEHRREPSLSDVPLQDDVPAQGFLNRQPRDEDEYQGQPRSSNGPFGGLYAPFQQKDPSQPAAAPAAPSPGYALGDEVGIARGDFRSVADTLREALISRNFNDVEGKNTSTKILIETLTSLDPLQMAAVKETYKTRFDGRDLSDDVKSHTPNDGPLQQGLLEIVNGPLISDVISLHDAVQPTRTGMGIAMGLGITTNKTSWLLTDILVGRTNADLNAIKIGYERTFHRILSADVENSLAFKTRGLFKAILLAKRHEETLPIDDGEGIQKQADAIFEAGRRWIKDVDMVCQVLVKASNREIRAIHEAFRKREEHTPLEKFLEQHFSGLMKDVLVRMVKRAVDPVGCDAELLEECMTDLGTNRERLVRRVVMLHWNRAHLNRVKRVYKDRFGAELLDRLRGRTDGDYQHLMMALLA